MDFLGERRPKKDAVIQNNISKDLPMSVLLFWFYLFRRKYTNRWLQKNRFQIVYNPNKYVFYKCLVGDNADNIKGISGIGKKRATEIVKNCFDFEELLIKATNLLPKKIVLSLCEEKDKFLLNKRIITLTYNDEIIYDLNDFIFNEQMISLTNSQILSLNNIFD